MPSKDLSFGSEVRKLPSPAARPQSAGVRAMAAPRPRTVKGVSGALPRGTGVLTEYEAEQLAKLGWKDGDPLPDLSGDLEAVIAETVAEDTSAADSKLAETMSKGARVKPPREVDIDDLPPPARKRLEAALAAAKIKAAQPPAPRADMSPSVRAALDAATGADRISAAKVEKAGKDEAPAAPEQAPPRLASGAGGNADAKTHCPRCAWDIEQPFEAKITPEDKRRFQVSVLGDGQRFTKWYKMLDGLLEVKFRTLTSNESKLCVHQALRDECAGRFCVMNEYLIQSMDYRLCLSIDEIVYDGHTVQVGKLVDDFMRAFVPEPVPSDKDGKTSSPVLPPDTALPRILAAMLDLVPLSSESVWRLVSTTHRTFQLLVEKIEGEGMSADF